MPDLEPSCPSLAEVRRRVLKSLTDAGIEEAEARRETDLIVGYATGFSLAHQLMRADEPARQEWIDTAAKLVAQRRERIPIQYLLGSAPFMGLDLHIVPGVFIPRSDTEAVIEVMKEKLPPDAADLVAEIGTGSGAIAVALLVHFKYMQVIGIDISAAAIELTRRNAIRHGVMDRLNLVQGDWKEMLPKNLRAIVSNPPYIPLSDRDELMPEVRLHEPPEALFGSERDGLGFYRSLASAGQAHLVSGGTVVVEIGDGQAEAVSGIFRSNNWLDVSVHDDINKKRRVIAAASPSE